MSNYEVNDSFLCDIIKLLERDDKASGFERKIMAEYIRDMRNYWHSPKKLERERYMVNTKVDEMAFMYSKNNEGLVRHIEEKSLREMGYEYAKRYAHKLKMYVYDDPKNNCLQTFREKQDDKDLKLMWVEYRFEL